MNEYIIFGFLTVILITMTGILLSTMIADEKENQKKLEAKQ